MNSTEQNPGDVHGFFSRDNIPVCEASVQIPGKSVMSFLTGSPEPGRSLDANSFQPCDTAERALKTWCLTASLLFLVAKCDSSSSSELGREEGNSFLFKL